MSFIDTGWYFISCVKDASAIAMRPEDCCTCKRATVHTYQMMYQWRGTEGARAFRKLTFNGDQAVVCNTYYFCSEDCCTIFLFANELA